MKKTLLFFLFFHALISVAQTTVTGIVIDSILHDPLPNTTIKISKKNNGTTTNFNGKFSLNTLQKLPFTIEISSLGYKTKIVEITKKNQVLKINLQETTTSLDEVIISASRTPEKIMESPVTIERIDTKTIKNNTSVSFYDGLENLKGVDVNTSGLTFKSVNTRGFSDISNLRFMQLVDGMDNSSPSLNFALGNLLGLSELDVHSVEILPGAASALYGANAFNGILLMTSKSPFKDDGVSAMVKGGITSQAAAGNNPYYDASVRIAHKFNDYFAAKATISLLKGEEWHATDYRNTTGVSGIYTSGDRNSKTDYDGLNVYGDEVVINIRNASGLGIIPNVNVSRTGYLEADLVDNNARSLKFGAALHYRPFKNEKLEIIWNSKYGIGNAIYQGQNRYYINNFLMAQHKLEVLGKNFFVRGYVTNQDAGDTYDTRFAGININRQWKSDEDWFSDYIEAYATSLLINPNIDTDNAHANARIIADEGIFEPGSTEFKEAFNKVIADSDLTSGAKFKDETGLFHIDGNYNFKDDINWAEIQLGVSYRNYKLNSFGSIYTDYNGPIYYNEYGIYSQIQKKILEDKLKLTGSIRYDKSQNFEGHFSPKISASYALDNDKKHNVRVSFQTAFRNPTTQDQYIGLSTGASYIIGSVADNLERYIIEEDISEIAQSAFGEHVSLDGLDAYTNSFSSNSVINYQEGNNSNTTLLEQSDLNLVKPEKITSIEIGYRSAIDIGNKKLSIDFNTYYNNYDNFLSLTNVDTPFYGSFNTDGIADENAIAAINNGDYATFHFRTNTKTNVSSYGAAIGVQSKVFDNFDIGLNYAWTDFNFNQEDDPDFEAGFNTPKHKVKFEFGHTNVIKNLGFNVNLRWQNEFYWQSVFLESSISERTVLDAQVNYKFSSISSTFKLGGTNLGGKEYTSAPGAGAIGSIYYLSWVINN